MPFPRSWERPETRDCAGSAALAVREPGWERPDPGGTSSSPTSSEGPYGAAGCLCEENGARASDENLIDVNEVAALLGIARKTVYGLVQERKIPYIKPTRMTLRFRRTDIEAWLETRTIRPRD